MLICSQGTVLVGLMTVTVVLCALVCASSVEADMITKASTLSVQDESARWTCVGCTMAVALVSQLAEKNNVSAKKAFRLLCDFFPSPGPSKCKVAGTFFGKKTFNLIDEGKTPDEVCRATDYCHNPTCHLFPQTAHGRAESRVLRSKGSASKMGMKALCKVFPGICKSTPAGIPLLDLDGDLFSTAPGQRGTNWRGRDCNDRNNSIFPGRDTLDANVDENCNGIYGVDKATGKTYEDLWCRQSGAMGVISVGDSATAQFGIPGGLLNVSELSKKMAASILVLTDNEFDWPMLSFSTGHMQTKDYAPGRTGPMTSIYSELLKLNRCNHRDYQNIGVNGAETTDLPSMMDLVARNRATSVKPAMMILSFVGNDVCNFPPTSPTSYYENFMTALGKADDLLPLGSHVVIAPVADGRILYDTMHDRVHPIGSLHSDVTYASFYDFLNCLESSPCPGWLNTDAAVRNSTWAAAQELNAQIPRIMTEAGTKYKNIKVHYLGDAVVEVLKQYKGPIWELIEPVDGFHPSQLAHSLMGKYYTEKIVEAGIVGPANPFNDAIIERFGDQGGY